MNYEDNFIESFSALISSNNNGLKNDLTIIGVITKEGANEGEYYVSYQGEEYLVYSTAGTSFRKNDRVYVIIPQGDYSLQKFILGKEKNGDNDTVQYSDPETLITPMQTYKFNDITLKDKLCLDCTTDETTRFSDSYMISVGKDKDISDLLYKYDTLAIKASFIAMLKDGYSGNYGLKITISGPSGDKKDYFEEYCLDSSNMFGTIYNFYSPSEQMIVLDISNFNSINTITFQVYTLGIVKQGTEGIKEIIVEELELIFGYNKNNSKYGTALLSSAQGEKFNYSPTKEELEGHSLEEPVDYSKSIKKDLQLILFRKAEDFSDLCVKIYKYNDYDKNWEHIYGEETGSAVDCCFKIDTILTGLKLDITKKEIRYKAVLFDRRKKDEFTYDEIKIVESNELIFVNNAPISDNDSVNNMETIKIFASGSDGVHYSYDENNELIFINGKQQTEFKLLIKEYTENKEGNKEWVDITEKVQGLIFSQNDNSSNSMITVNNNNKDKIYTYTIKTSLSSSNYNNTISASFVYKGVTYNLHKNLLFGYQGTSGSDYTFVLIPDYDEKTISPQIYNMQNIITTPNEIKIDWEIIRVFHNLDGSKVSNINKLEIAFDYSKIQNSGEKIENIADSSIMAVRANAEAEIDNKKYYFSAVLSYQDYKRNLSGCDRVEYLSDGITARYFKQPYLAQNPSGNYNYKYPYYWYRYIIKKEDSIEDWYKNGNFETERHGGSFIPSPKTENFPFCEFIALQINATNAPSHIEEKTEYFETIIPIVYTYNTYSSSLVNKWDGKSLTLNEKDSFIASNMIAAGSKDSQNRFSGVLLGDYKGYADSSVSGLTGIYGFDRGEQAYAFREDGTAFIGKAGAGRIWFDGNNGVIASDSWFQDGKYLGDQSYSGSLPSNGIRLDLDQALFEARREEGNAIVKISPGEETYFEVSTEIGNPWGGSQDVECYLKFKSNGMTEISAAKMSGILMYGWENFLRGTLDIGDKDSDTTTRHASLSSITENDVVKGVFKGYGSKGDYTNVGACVVSGNGAALKFLGADSYVSVVNDSVTIKSSKIYLNGQVTFDDDDIYINDNTLESYIKSVVSDMLK